MTLSVLAIMLVLVVAFATLSRTEVGSAANYRDYVASKYLAQGGLNRAMAEIAFAYAGNSNTFNTGLGSIYSSVNTNGWSFSSVVSGGNAPAWFATDVETVVTNSRTGQVYARRGADNVVDYVVLPNQFSNANYTAQWIGMRDTNGLLVGRVAYIVTAGGLNINAIGNLVSSTLPNGMRENARNQGQSVCELNLPAALMAMNSDAGTGWSFANATNDLHQILSDRYGPDGKPGDSGTVHPEMDSDGIDNNGDGRVDEVTPKPEGELILPLRYLAKSDGTDKTTIQVGAMAWPGTDDRSITDLKQLYDGSIGDTSLQTRFRNNFSAVRRWFTTQSTIPVPPTLIPINDTANFPNTAPGRQAFFEALTNRFAQINFPTNDLVAQAQVAANIATYAWPAPDAAGGLPPLNLAVNGTNVVGVARVPLINEVDFEFIANVQLNVPPTNIVVTLRYTPKVELWCPYTNGFSVATTVTLSNQVTVSGGAGGNPAVQMPSKSTTLFAPCTFSAIINAPRFQVLTMPAVPIGTPRTWVNVDLTPINAAIRITNLVFAAREEDPAGQILDYCPSFRTNISLIFPTNLLMQVTNGGWATRSVEFTNIISFALNDPRIKQWGVEYAGLHTNSVAKSSLGGVNFNANLTSDTCEPPITTVNPIFRPDLGEDSDFIGQVGQGIGPATFYVKHKRYFSSIAELGRIHRGQPWRTIDFKGGGTDGNLLDHVTTISNMWGGASYTFAHGRVNINARSDALPIWAALFAGMPFQYTQADGSKTTPVFFDYTTGASPQIDSNFPKSKEFGKIFGSRAGALTHLGALTAVADLSNLSSNHALVFPSSTFKMPTDEDKEQILSRMINLIGTSGQGNTFTIYAWGQSLRGPPAATPITPNTLRAANTNRMVTAETLIVAMVRPEVQSDGKLSLKLIYYRYNPDLELYQGF